MKLSKIISVMLAALILLSFGGITAAAASGISTAAITDLVEPVVGWSPSYSFSVSSAGFHKYMPGSGAIWYESKDGTNFTKLASNWQSDEDKVVFAADNYYKFETELQADSGYYWESNMLNVTVNGKKAQFSVKNDVLNISIVFGPVGYDQVVTDCSISDVTEPAAGKAPKYSFSISQYSHCQPALPGAGAIWYCSYDGGVNFEELPTNGEDVKFEAGGVYKFYTQLEADPGYTLAGSVMAVINGQNANSQVRIRPNGTPYIEMSYTFPPLGNNILYVSPAGGADIFATYRPGLPTKAYITVKNSSGPLKIEWFECDAMGNKLSADPIGSGLSAFLPPIPQTDMMVNHYVYIIVTEDGGSRSCAAVIPYVLFPAGFEDPALAVKLKGGSNEIVTTTPSAATKVELEISNNISAPSVDWFRCDSSGNPDLMDPIGHGTSFELPGIDAADANKKYYFYVYAEDDRGGDSAGVLMFTYMLNYTPPTDAPTQNPTEVPVTQAPSTPAPTDVSTAEAPTGPNATEAPEKTDGSDVSTDVPVSENTSENSSGSTSKPAENEPAPKSSANPLLIALIVIGALLLCAACVIIGLLIGKKSKK